MDTLKHLHQLPQGLLQLRQGLEIERNANTVRVVLKRQDDLNRITDEVLDELQNLCELLHSDEQASVMTITGEGGEYFSTGLLNPALRAKLSKDQVLALVWKANRVFDAIEALPQLVIAAINGKAIAGGLELALACDIRYASSVASVRLPEAGWGGFPGAGAPVRLPELVGKANALDLICSGQETNAQELLRIGLVQRVIPNEQFDGTIRDIVAQIGKAGPLAVKGAKKVAATRLEPGFTAARRLSDALRQALEWSEDVDEGMRAAKEKRQPQFKGR